ncbi:MAG: hypothetical protein ABIL68_15715 [bacterium]
MDKKIRELLYRSFDESLTFEEDRLLKEALRNSKVLQEENKRIAKMRRSVSDSAAQSFRPFFSRRVMRRIEESRVEGKNGEAFFEALVAVFRPVAVGVAVVIVVLLSYNIIKSDRVSLAGAFAEPQLTLEEAFDPTITFAME